MDVKEIEHKYLDELSGGQRQRAYIAMILAQDTKYIFLDEPLNNSGYAICRRNDDDFTKIGQRLR